MGWVNDALAALRGRQSITIRPFGGSMRGRIESGQHVTIAPIDTSPLQVNDIVLVRWKGNYLLHPIVDIQDEQLLIGNNLGKINGWVHRSDVRGKVIDILPEE